MSRPKRPTCILHLTPSINNEINIINQFWQLSKYRIYMKITTRQFKILHPSWFIWTTSMIAMIWHMIQCTHVRTRSLFSPIYLCFFLHVMHEIYQLTQMPIYYLFSLFSWQYDEPSTYLSSIFQSVVLLIMRFRPPEWRLPCLPADKPFQPLPQVFTVSLSMVNIIILQDYILNKFNIKNTHLVCL